MEDSQWELGIPYALLKCQKQFLYIYLQNQITNMSYRDLRRGHTAALRAAVRRQGRLCDFGRTVRERDERPDCTRFPHGGYVLHVRNMVWGHLIDV